MDRPHNFGALRDLQPVARAASQCMPSKKKTADEIQRQVQMNITRQQEMHMQKTTKSDANFQNTRVCTGEKIFVKNGKAVAVGFKQNPHIRAHVNDKKSMEQTSINADTFKVRPMNHVGMVKKPLEPYSMNAHRSRLPSPTIFMPYKNSSQIVIGDRSSYNKRQFVTTNTNSFANRAGQITSNPGIVSEVTKRQHHAMDL